MQSSSFKTTIVEERGRLDHVGSEALRPVGTESLILERSSNFFDESGLDVGVLSD